MDEKGLITSLNNERLAHFRKVRDGKVDGQIFLEGVRLVEETLRSHVELLDCVATPAMADSDRGAELINDLTKRSIKVNHAAERAFKTVAETASSQGIAVISNRPVTGPEKILEAFAINPPGPLIFLQEINDPSNLGAVFRTAEAAGAVGVIVSKLSTDPFSAKALRAAMGSNLRLPIWEHANIYEGIDWARERGMTVRAADIGGKISYSAVDWKKPSMIVFGSEAHGLTEGVLEMVDEIITIPMKNGVESLNLAVSAGIVLFEAVRQNSQQIKHTF